MEFKDCIQKRMSTRAYRPDPVPGETIQKILETALRAPSWGNTQPWEVFVVSGDRLKRIGEELVARFQADREPNPDVEMPAEFPELYTDRYMGLGKALLTTMGIARDDEDARLGHSLNMYRFFGAPVCLYLTFDSSLMVPYSMLDIGILTQSICLAATDDGLGTCIMAMVTKYPDIVREIAGIPDGKRIVVGIALGYPDPDAPANRFRSDRAPLAETVTFIE